MIEHTHVMERNETTRRNNAEREKKRKQTGSHLHLFQQGKERGEGVDAHGRKVVRGKEQQMHDLTVSKGRGSGGGGRAAAVRGKTYAAATRLSARFRHG